MSTDTLGSGTTAEETVPVRAHGTVLKQFGHWTRARRFDVRASRGSVVLALRSPLIAAGDIEYLADALRARREGRYPTIDDPTR